MLLAVVAPDIGKDIEFDHRIEPVVLFFSSFVVPFTVTSIQYSYVHVWSGACPKEPETVTVPE